MKKGFAKIVKFLCFALLAVVLVTTYRTGDVNAATSKVVKKGQTYDFIGDGHIPYFTVKIEALTEDTVYDFVYYSSIFYMHPIANIVMDCTTDYEASPMGMGLYEAATYKYDENGSAVSDKMLLGSIKVKKGKVRVTFVTINLETWENMPAQFTAKKVKHDIYNTYKLKANEKYVFECKQRAKSKWTNKDNGTFYMLVNGKVGTTLTSSFTVNDTTYSEFMKLGKKNVIFTKSYSDEVYNWEYISSNKNSRLFSFNYNETMVPCTTTEFVADKAMTLYLPYEYTLKRIKTN